MSQYFRLLRMLDGSRLTSGSFQLLQYDQIRPSGLWVLWVRFRPPALDLRGYRLPSSSIYGSNSFLY